MLQYYTHADQHRLLGFLCGPLRESLCGCSLRTGFVLLALLDIVSGGLATVNLATIATYSSSSLTIEQAGFLAFTVAAALFKVFLGLSALVGILGINSLNISKISQYSTMKTLNLAVEFVFGIIYIMFLLPEVPKESKVGFMMLTMGALAISLLIISYAALVVWSAYIRLCFNETILVFQGVAMATVFNQNAMVIQGLPNQQRVIPAGHAL